jgi:hypothetical protein
LGQVPPVGHDHRDFAAVQQRPEFGIGATRVHRHPDHRGPHTGQQHLGVLHPVVQVDRHPLTPADAEAGEVAREPSRAVQQRAIGGGPPGVAERLLVRIALGVRSHRVEQRTGGILVNHAV